MCAHAIHRHKHSLANRFLKKLKCNVGRGNLSSRLHLDCRALSPSPLANILQPEMVCWNFHGVSRVSSYRHLNSSPLNQTSKRSALRNCTKTSRSRTNDERDTNNFHVDNFQKCILHAWWMHILCSTTENVKHLNILCCLPLVKKGNAERQENCITSFMLCHLTVLDKKKTRLQPSERMCSYQRAVFW